jgi:hypothetical protein
LFKAFCLWGFAAGLALAVELGVHRRHEVGRGGWLLLERGEKRRGKGDCVG